MRSQASADTRPIFVVGSPRSGTSILTWSLGQHPNILAQEESDWLGLLTINLQAAYEHGTRRGHRSQLWSLGVTQEEFFASFGEAINDLIMRHRAQQLNNAREYALAVQGSPEIIPTFQIKRAESDPKQRWIDGTPEYSFYISGLRKLFPGALFIHLVRDAASVVRSMLHFASLSGTAVAASEEDAYDYWLRAVRACLQAEKAYGSGVVCRVRYIDLAKEPERVVRKILEFVDEPFEPACLEPLLSRINSSQVPAEFEPAPPRASEQIVAAAHKLNEELSIEAKYSNTSGEAAAALERAFLERVLFHQNVSDYYRKSLAKIAQLEKKVEALQAKLTADEQSGGSWLRRALRSR